MNPQHCHLPIARITMHTEGEGRKSRPTPTPPPRISSRCERGNARYLPSFAPDPIPLFRPFVVSSSEYARPTDVTPTLNGDHRQRATDDGRTERAGGRDGVARARALLRSATLRGQADGRASAGTALGGAGWPARTNVAREGGREGNERGRARGRNRRRSRSRQGGGGGIRRVLLLLSQGRRPLCPLDRDGRTDGQTEREQEAEGGARLPRCFPLRQRDLGKAEARGHFGPLNLTA